MTPIYFNTIQYYTSSASSLRRQCVISLQGIPSTAWAFQNQLLQAPPGHWNPKAQRLNSFQATVHHFLKILCWRHACPLPAPLQGVTRCCGAAVRCSGGGGGSTAHLEKYIVSTSTFTASEIGSEPKNRSYGRKHPSWSLTCTCGGFELRLCGYNYTIYRVKRNPPTSEAATSGVPTSGTSRRPMAGSR